MATHLNQNKDPKGADGGGTGHSNYTAQRIGNDHGNIKFGHIHKDAGTTSGVLLETTDSLHHITLDKAGQRKGHTISVSPGDTVIEAGEKNTVDQTTIVINAVNGDISLIASNGKIRMQADDIEMIANGGGGNKGNIVMRAVENIKTDSKKFLVNATNFYKIVTPGYAEICANSGMILYASLIRGVTDAVAVKDSKVGGQKIQRENNKV
jgi:uncharacterized protein (DUF2345 family)